MLKSSKSHKRRGKSSARSKYVISRQNLVLRSFLQMTHVEAVSKNAAGLNLGAFLDAELVSPPVSGPEKALESSCQGQGSGT